MTREEFVRAYATRSNISAEWANLGFIEVGGRVRIALPCGCKETNCEGWAMISPDNIDYHLKFNAPAELKSAYRKAVGQQ